MRKLVAGLVVIGFGVAVAVTGRPVPVSNAAFVGPGGFTFQFQMQPISLPELQIDLPIFHQEQPVQPVQAVKSVDSAADVEEKPAAPASAVSTEQTQIQTQSPAHMTHSCSGW